MEDAEKALGGLAKFIWRIILVLLWIPISIVMGLSFLLSYHWHDKWIEWSQKIWDIR